MSPFALEQRRLELIRHLAEDDLTPNYEKLKELRKNPGNYEKRKRVD